MEYRPLANVMHSCDEEMGTVSESFDCERKVTRARLTTRHPPVYETSNRVFKRNVR